MFLSKLIMALFNCCCCRGELISTVTLRTGLCPAQNAICQNWNKTNHPQERNTTDPDHEVKACKFPKRIKPQWSWQKQKLGLPPNFPGCKVSVRRERLRKYASKKKAVFLETQTLLRHTHTHTRQLDSYLCEDQFEFWVECLHCGDILAGPPLVMFGYV